MMLFSAPFTPRSSFVFLCDEDADLASPASDTSLDSDTLPKLDATCEAAAEAEETDAAEAVVDDD